MSVVIYMQPRFFGNNYFRKSAHSAARVELQCLKEVFKIICQHQKKSVYRASVKEL